MKRFLSSLLILLIIIGMVPMVGFGDTSSNNGEPMFAIEGSDIPVVNPGADTSINLKLKNIGGDAAYDIIMTPIYDGSGPFKANSLTPSINVPNDYTKNPIKLNLSVSSDAVPGTYPVTLRFDYKRYVSSGESYNQVPGSQELIIYIKVSGDSTKPRLIISEAYTDPKIINPGQTVKLNVLFENKGSLEAKDIRTKLTGLNSNGGFTIASGSDVNYIKTARGNSVSYVTYNIKAANNIKRGSHELEVTFNYGGIEETQKIYLNVGGGGAQSSNLVMENISYPTGGVGVNKDFVIRFDLRNNGTITASNIIVKAESGDSAVVPKSTSIKKINNISGDKKESLEFVFTATEDAISRNYPINITVEYEDEFNTGGENKNIINQYVGMYVIKAGESDGKGKPKLIIDKYNFTPDLVRAGENFEMNLSFFNTNNSKAVKNIKIFLTADERTDPNSPSAGGSVFTPVDSSNTFYIDSIPPKGRVEKKITMFTVPDAQAKTYTMTANFEYEDNEGIEYTATELIGVPVIQQSKLEIGEIGQMPEAYPYQPAPISLEFFNTGKVTLYNMMVKLEGDFQTENAQYYVGNFVSGGSEYFEGYVIPNEPGELHGAVVFSYEDSTGTPQEIRQEFTLNVMDMPDFEEPFPGDFPPMEEGKGGILKNKFLWIGLALLGIIIGVVVFRKRKNKQKELSLDE